MAAVNAGSVDIVKLLINAGADVNATDPPTLNENATAPLGAPKSLEDIIDLMQEGQRSSPLLIAERKNLPEIVEELEKAGAASLTSTRSPPNPSHPASTEIPGN
jgi:ankyrin repeat protein